MAGGSAMTNTCMPVIVLNRDHSLDKLSLNCSVNGAQKCVVGLARDEKLDRLAVDYCDSFTDSGIVLPGRQSPLRRERLSLTTAFIQLRSGTAASNRKRKRWTLTAAPLQDGYEDTAKLDNRRKRTLSNISIQDDGDTSASLDSRTERTFNNASDKGCTEKSGIQTSANVSSRDACAKSTTLDCRSRLTLANPSNQDCESDISDRPTSSSHISQDEITREDFMALHSLSPTHVIQRARKCTHHQISKYLHIKSRDLWIKICGERNHLCTRLFPDTKTVQRPYVLLKRSSAIDRLAVQQNPQSINLKSYMGISKAANYRKLLNDSRGKILHNLNVKLKRDSCLDQLALQISNGMCTSCSLTSSGTKALSPCIAGLTSAVPSTHTPLSQASEKSSRKRAFVKINRNAGLDAVVLQRSNLKTEPLSSNSARITAVSACEDELATVPKTLSNDLEQPSPKKLLIMINRDPSIDQLALQNFNTTITDSCSGCSNSIDPSHLDLYPLPTSKLPLNSTTSIPSHTKLHGGGMDKSLNHPCSTKSGLIDVIKLKKVSWSDWSVIHPGASVLKTPDAKHADIELNENQCDDLFQPQPSRGSVSHSTGSRSAALKRTRTAWIGQLDLPTSSSGRHVGGADPDNQSHDIQASVNQPTLSQLPSEQPIFRPGPSTRKSFSGMMRTVSSDSCTVQSTRAKAVPSKEETIPEAHHNENETPQKHIVSPVKTVILNRKHLLTVGVVNPLVLRKSHKRNFENHLLDHTKLRATRQKDHPNLVKPSITDCMPIKKPLGQRSPNSQSA